MPRLRANSFVRGEVFACEPTMLIHSKPGLFSPLQLLVPLWSIPRLPMQQLAPHWEFAGASSQMTLSSATNCAITQWTMRGAVTNNQVRRPGLKETSQLSTGKTSWFQSASGLAVATSTLSVHPLQHQTCHICQHVSSWLYHSSPARFAMLPAAAGPSTGAKTQWGSSWSSKSGKGTVGRARFQQ